jgi:hypothetical protein
MFPLTSRGSCASYYATPKSTFKNLTPASPHEQLMSRAQCCCRSQATTPSRISVRSRRPLRQAPGRARPWGNFAAPGKLDDSRRDGLASPGVAIDVKGVADFLTRQGHRLNIVGSNARANGRMVPIIQFLFLWDASWFDISINHGVCAHPKTAPEGRQANPAVPQPNENKISPLFGHR